jgi:hypothetical protein
MSNTECNAVALFKPAGTAPDPLAADMDPFLLGGHQPDQVLLAAERDLAASRARCAALPEGPEADAAWREIDRLQLLVLFTAPDGLPGVLVKLRLVTDPNLGVESGERIDHGDTVAMRQVLRLLEGPTAPQLPAPLSARIAGIAALAPVAAGRHPPTAGSDTMGRELLSLLHEWHAADRLFAGMPLPREAPRRFDEVCGRCDELFARLSAMPASDAVGLAAKIVLLARLEFGLADPDDRATLRPFDDGEDYTEAGELESNKRLLRDLLADAVSILPEYEPCARPVLASPLCVAA